MSTKLSKYISAFDYFGKTLIALAATSGALSNFSFAYWRSCRNRNPIFTVTFSLTTGIIKEVLETTINKKKKHNKIAVLPRRKLNSNETLIPQALIDLEISHEEFKTIVNQKEKYEKMKEDNRMKKSSDELGGNIKISEKIEEVHRTCIKCL